MDKFRIFYAWQSDRPSKLCRSLIRRALDGAVKQLRDDLAIEVSQRIEVEIDQDTQGESGSPPVAETIFRKIRESDAFVADLTFTGTRVGKTEPPVPNPNVLIEYGYALSALGEERIIAVFNEAFGKRDDLPFDLRHRRWPLPYRTSGDESDEKSKETRCTERKELTRKLVKAVKAIVQNAGKHQEDPAADDPKPLAEQIPLTKVVVLHDEKEFLFSQEAKVRLCLRPKLEKLELTNRETRDIAFNSLEPLGTRGLAGQSCAQVSNGAAIVKYPKEGSKEVRFASILFRNGTLYGIACCAVSQREIENLLTGNRSRFVPMGKVEETLRDGLHNFLEVARKLPNLTLPLDVQVELEGAKGCHLGDGRLKYSDDLPGPLWEDRIEGRFQTDSYGADPATLLEPFFDKIYDEAGGATRAKSNTSDF